MNYDSQTMIFTVTQVNEYVKMLLDSSPVLSHVSLRGEISNLTNHYKSGHLYFSMKDEGGLIRGVMFRSAAQYLKFEPENGMRVIVHGRISSYPRDGQYQIYVEEMEPDGIGALAIAFEQRKEKLAREGLFDESRKKKLPKFPKVIGVITSPTGAAVRDVINILSRRYPPAKMILFPTLVQGDGAPRQLISGITYFNRSHSCDVILIGRGGGSLEDLWAFNDEQLARTIADSDIPVISAVGHETDFTICDFVSDLRAPTPSAAAELAVPDMTELKNGLQQTYRILQTGIHNKIATQRQAVQHLSESRCLLSMHYYTDERRMDVAGLEKQLLKYYNACLQSRLTQVNTISTSLFAEADRILSRKTMKLQTVAGKLHAMDPMAVLSRGYGAVYCKNGTSLTSLSQVKINDSITVQVTDGKMLANVNELIPTKNMEER